MSEVPSGSTTPITYASGFSYPTGVAVDVAGDVFVGDYQNGAVKDIEILEYREAYGDDVRKSEWRSQFIGKTKDASLKLTGDIQNISGATLSCKHITDGVRRLLATYALVVANH